MMTHPLNTALGAGLYPVDFSHPALGAGALESKNSEYLWILSEYSEFRMRLLIQQVSIVNT